MGSNDRCQPAARGHYLPVAACVCALLSPAVAQAETAAQSFTTSGESQFIVPAGVSSLQVTLVGGNGAAGGAGNSGFHAPGGAGATAVATLAVSPGQILFTEVAGDGLAGGAGGYGGGGSDIHSGETGGGGGGASDVQTCSATANPASCPGGSSLGSRLVVAAGGGGGGRGGADTGDAAVIKGGAGGSAGAPGGAGAFDPHGDSGGEGGQPGGPGSPGAPGGDSAEAATAGQFGLGGSGGTSLAAAGGGGGGGVFGGGGGGGGLAFAEMVGLLHVFNSAGGGGGGGGSGVPAGAAGVSGFSLAPTPPGAEPSLTFTWTLPPPAAVTGTATALTSASASLTGAVNPDGSSVSDCHFVISPAPPGGALVPCAQQVGAGGTPVAVSATLTGLTPASAYAVTLLASSAQGSSSGSTVGFVTLARASGSAGLAPAITNVKLSTTRFRRGKHAATIARTRSKGIPTATVIGFGLSGAAPVTLSFEQAEAGVLVGHRCTAVTARNRKGRRCTRYQAVSHGVTRTARAGANRITFDGVLDGGGSLSPGVYRLSLLAGNAVARVAAPQHPVFTLLG
jgi:hypothetical protein